MTALLTLEEAKKALRLRDDDTDRDELVEQFVEGVTSVVEARVGWVVPRELTVEIRQGGVEVALPGSRVLSLTSGAFVDGGDPVDVSGMSVGVGGVIRMIDGSGLPSRPWSLTLQVGMDPIPDAIRRGAAEILIEAWATQRGTPGSDDEIRPFLVPHRAAAWFTGYELYHGFA